jgi:hypothetical protein
MLVAAMFYEAIIIMFFFQFKLLIDEWGFGVFGSNT